MWRQRLGQVEFAVDHRSLAGDAGATLRVSESRDGGRELLRFDCFRQHPHFHIDPGGRDEIAPLDPLTDAVDWTISALRRDLAGYLEKAGYRDPPGVSASEIDRALSDAEAAMRNPPVDFDRLDVPALRTRLGEKWAHYGDGVIPAWVAEMDFPLAEPIREVLRRAADRSDLGYPLDAHETGLPEAFAERMETRFGWAVDPARVVILADVVQGLYACLDTLSDPGDGAVVQTAIYPPFLHSVKETGRRLLASPLRHSPVGIEMDLETLARTADPRARLLMLCNPHNPTGRVFSRSELEALAQFAAERGLIVVSDEIHADLVYPGRQHIPFASLGAEAAGRTVTLTSATKAFNIPGLRCAVAHFGSPELQQRFERRHPLHARGGVGLLGIYATLAAWRHAQPWLDRVLAYLDGNRRFLRDTIARDLPGVVFHEPQATYLAWLDCRALDLPRSPGHFFLRRAGVALSDGHHFGEGFEGFVRLNFATSRELLAQILERMSEAMRTRGDAAADQPSRPVPHR